MACPTCNHTMQNLGMEAERKFWCNRCGTVKSYTGEFENVSVPRWTRLAKERDFQELLHDVGGTLHQIADNYTRG